MPVKRETFKFTGKLPANLGLNREEGDAWVTITMSENLVRNGRENIANSLKRKLRDVCTIPMLMEGDTVPEVRLDFVNFPNDTIRVLRSGIQIVMGKTNGTPDCDWWVVKDDLFHPTLGSREQQFGRGIYFAKIRDGECLHRSVRMPSLSEAEKLEVNQLIEEAKNRGRTSEYTQDQWENWWGARWRLTVEVIS